MKKYLLTGLIILLPIALTMMVIIFLFNLFTTPFVSIVGKLFKLISEKAAFTLPHDLDMFISRILALLLLLAFIFLLGVFARWFIIKNLLAAANHILSRIPIIKTVYKVSRDIIIALFSSDGNKAFKYPVMLPFPHSSSYAIGFRSGEVAEEIQKKVNVPLMSVFSPTAPHPISGFLFLMPKEHVHKIDMTNEEALKFLVSCGVIHPNSHMRRAEDDDVF